MQPDRTRSEVHTLEELLVDFADDGWGPKRAAEAFDLVADRYRTLSHDYVTFANWVALSVANGTPLPVACRAVLRLAHLTLFEGLFWNAGIIRQAGDPGGSAVYFGGQKPQRHSMRFSGTRAEQIEDALAPAFARLADYRGGSIEDLEAARDEAVRFYADLSRIHPFYDANGRTGRFVVSVYLHLHGWLVEWGRLEKRDNEFIKRINNVNEKATAETDYDAFLVNFWMKYTVRTDGLE